MCIGFIIICHVNLITGTARCLTEQNMRVSTLINHLAAQVEEVRSCYTHYQFCQGFIHMDVDSMPLSSNFVVWPPFLFLFFFFEKNKFSLFFFSFFPDYNECSYNGMCTNGMCVNMDGSFKCICNLGYTLSAGGEVCIGIDIFPVIQNVSASPHLHIMGFSWVQWNDFH